MIYNRSYTHSQAVERDTMTKGVRFSERKSFRGFPLKLTYLISDLNFIHEVNNDTNITDEYRKLVILVPP